MEGSSPRIKPYLDCWDVSNNTHNLSIKLYSKILEKNSSFSQNDDKYSVANSQVPLQIDEDEHPERGTWTGKYDFLLSLLGYSVGLGNVWRFPYLCYSNGGGAFLIPFTVMLVIAGLPLMFMELSLGQYSSLGPVAAYKRFCPLLRGLGYGMVLISTIVMFYYNLIIAWTIYYMFASVAGDLPWDGCKPPWSTDDCFILETFQSCIARNMTYYKRECRNSSEFIGTDYDMHNITVRTPAEEYFK